MECIENNFLTQVFSGTTEVSSVLNLLLTNREGLLSSSVKVDGSFSSINYETAEYKKWKGVKINIRLTTLDFR